jgi:hypothetical protein
LIPSILRKMSKATSLCLLIAAASCSFATMITAGDEFAVNRAADLRAGASRRRRGSALV